MSLNGKVIGTAKDVQVDWPWVRGTFVSTPDFGAVRHLFDEEYQCVRDKRDAEHATVMDKIWSLGFKLESPIHGIATGCKIEDAVRSKNIHGSHSRRKNFMAWIGNRIQAFRNRTPNRDLNSCLRSFGVALFKPAHLDAAWASHPSGHI